MNDFRADTTRRAAEGGAPSALIAALALAPAAALGANRPVFGAALAFLALAGLALRGGRLAYPPLAATLYLAALTWAAAQAISGLSADPDATWRSLARLGAYGALFALAAGAARAAGPRVIVRAAAVWVALLSLYGLAAWATGRNPIVGALEAYPDALEGPFVNRNAFALYAGFGVMAAISAALRGAAGARGRIRWLAQGGWVWLAMACTSALALAATGSRGGIAASALGLAVMLAAPTARRTAALTLAAGGTAAALGALTLSAARGGDPLDETRFGVHAALWRAIGDAPLLSRGLGAFQDAFRPYAAAEWRWGDWDHAHQMYLETAFELGLPAAFCLFGALALIGRDLLRAARRGSRSAALGLGAGVAAGAHGLVDFSLAVPAVPAALALLAGAGWGRGR